MDVHMKWKLFKISYEALFFEDFSTFLLFCYVIFFLFLIPYKKLGETQTRLLGLKNKVHFFQIFITYSEEKKVMLCTG